MVHGVSVSDNQQDWVRPFQIESGIARGRLVRLDASYKSILADRDYPAPVSRMLGESLVIATLLASGLKYDGAFTLQIKSDGAIDLLVADLSSDGALRGYARFDKDMLASALETKGAAVPRLFGGGYLAFTVDQGPDTERYQGITELTGATLGDCIHAYFRQSEQIETVVSLNVDPASSVAAGLMIQRMPMGDMDSEDAEEAWRRAAAFAGSVTPTELIDPALSATDLLYRLYHEDGVRVYDEKPVRFACRCSRDKVEGMLKSFSQDQLKDMKEDDGRIGVTCEFCGEHYSFGDDDLWAPEAS